jgi:hypothetical protein
VHNPHNTPLKILAAVAKGTGVSIARQVGAGPEERRGLIGVNVSDCRCVEDVPRAPHEVGNRHSQRGQRRYRDVRHRHAAPGAAGTPSPSGAPAPLKNWNEQLFHITIVLMR